MIATECPRCKEKEETVAYNESNTYDLWFCESCGHFYEVYYDSNGNVERKVVTDK